MKTRSKYGQEVISEGLRTSSEMLSDHEKANAILKRWSMGEFNNTDATEKINKELQEHICPVIKKNALRFNSGKTKWHNVPMFILEPVIRVGAFGEEKYPTFNFLKGFPVNELLNSLKRHLNSFESPFESDIDIESQQSHLAHVAWNALVALYVLNHKPELDDRYKDEEGIRLSDLLAREKP